MLLDVSAQVGAAAFGSGQAALCDSATDPDVSWLLEQLTERTFADGGVLARYFSDGRPPSAMAATGALAREHAAAETLMRFASAAAGTFRRRASEVDARIGWIDCSLLGGAWCGLVVALGGDRDERFAAALAYRAERQVAEEPARTTAERLMPLVDGYFRLWRKYRANESRVAGLAAALDLSSLGVIVIDRAGELMFVNRTAEAFLASSDGLRRSGRTVAATDLSTAMRLQVAISHVVANLGDGGGRRAPVIALGRAPGRRPFLCAVLPMRPAPIKPGDAAVVLHILNPDADIARLVAPVCRLLQLSPVECRLVVQLATGATLADAALSMRVKEQTARAYLKQIFLKTGTNRQADLVRVVLMSMMHVSNDTELVAI